MKIIWRGAAACLLIILGGGVREAHATSGDSEVVTEVETDPFDACIATSAGIESAEGVTDEVVARIRNLECTFNSRVTDLNRLEGATSLESLTVRSRSIDDISALGGLENLRTLQLMGAKITDLSVLEGLELLEELTLHDTTRVDLQTLPTLPKLKSLGLVNVEHTEFDQLPDLGGFESLRKLNVSGNRLGDLRQIVQYPQIETVTALNQFIMLREQEIGKTTPNPVVAFDDTAVPLEFRFARTRERGDGEVLCLDENCSEIIFAGEPGEYLLDFEYFDQVDDLDVSIQGQVQVAVGADGGYHPEQPARERFDLSAGHVASIIGLGLLLAAIFVYRFSGVKNRSVDGGMVQNEDF